VTAHSPNHTIHLAAIKVSNNLHLVLFYNLYCLFKLLEAIGAISKSEAKKAASRSGNYQDSTTAPLSHDHNDDAAAQEDTDQEDGWELLDVLLPPSLYGVLGNASIKLLYFSHIPTL